MTKTGLKVVRHVSIGLPLDSIGLLDGNLGSFMKFLWDVIWWQKGVKSYSDAILECLDVT